MDNQTHDDGNVRARWVRTSVEMLDHPLLNRGPFCRRAAWLWLIASAAWKPKTVRHKGAPLDLERGQVLIGRKHLAATWGWSEQNVRTFLNQCMGEGMLEINQSNGHYANVATICNYDKYQSSQPERHRDTNQSLTSAPPISNQTLTSTNLTNKNNTPREAKTISGRDFWSNAISASPDPETHAHVGVTLRDGRIELHNGTKQLWLERFENDEARLELALEQAAGFVQPNSNRPLEAQVSSQLAKQVADKTDKDRRYAAAAKAKVDAPKTAAQTAAERKIERHRGLMRTIDRLAETATQ